MHYENYSLAYSEAHEQAAWVAYELTKEEVVNKLVNRSDDYREDPNCRTGSASLEDYKYSGFDRGHLAPAADFCFSAKAMSECFYLTNISPQRAEFNRDCWLKLEIKTRDWAYQNEVLNVIVGPVLEEGLQCIGKNKVAVPNYYYRILLDNCLPEIKAIAFLMKNEGSNEELESFTVPIDSIEKLTGIDFFPALDDSLENALETGTNPERWFYDPEIKNLVDEALLDSKPKMQCMGIAKSTGKRCRIHFGLSEGYCRFHQSQRKQ